MPLSIHSVTSWTSTSTDDREDPSSKTRHEATYARLWHCLPSVVHSPTQLRWASLTSSGFKRCLLIISDTVLLGIANAREMFTALIPAWCIPITLHLWPTVVRTITVSLSVAPTVSFAARFSVIPEFKQSLSRNAFTKFHQIWHIYSKTLHNNTYKF